MQEDSSTDPLVDALADDVDLTCQRIAYLFAVGIGMELKIPLYVGE